MEQSLGVMPENVQCDCCKGARVTRRIVSEMVHLRLCRSAEAAGCALQEGRSMRGSLNWSSKLGMDSPYSTPTDGNSAASTRGLSVMDAGFTHPASDSVVFSRCGMLSLPPPSGSSGSCTNGMRLRTSTGSSGTLVRIGSDTGAYVSLMATSNITSPLRPIVLAGWRTVTRPACDDDGSRHSNSANSFGMPQFARASRTLFCKCHPRGHEVRLHTHFL